MPPTFMIPITDPRNRPLPAIRHEIETILQQDLAATRAGALSTAVAAWRGWGRLHSPAGKRPTPVQLREALRQGRVVITARLEVQLESERLAVEADQAEVYTA